MQEIITINGEKYVKYIEPEKKEYKRWRAEKWEYYYRIKNDGSIDDIQEELDNIDYWVYNIGNYYQTEEEATKERYKRLAIVRVNDAILSLNEWWKEEWNNRGQEKWCIMYNNDKKLFESGFNTYMIEWNLLYRIKSEEIADKIIKEHQEYLKLIFWVE